jgi:hypothetical protein
MKLLAIIAIACAAMVLCIGFFVTLFMVVPLLVIVLLAQSVIDYRQRQFYENK